MFAPASRAVGGYIVIATESVGGQQNYGSLIATGNIYIRGNCRLI